MTMTMIFGAIIFLVGGIVFGFIASGAFSSRAFSSSTAGKTSKPVGKRTSSTAAKTARKSPASKSKEDLKKISGVGPAIEKKLNAMGVTSYEQIANWTKADIAEADAKLNFKGRISRENWISQAKTLASGGETEFSKRKK